MSKGTHCVCGNVRDPNRPALFRLVEKPCTCDNPAKFTLPPLGTIGAIMRGAACRDPARARLGLPDRTPYEKHVLRGTFNE